MTVSERNFVMLVTFKVLSGIPTNSQNVLKKFPINRDLRLSEFDSTDKPDGTFGHIPDQKKVTMHGSLTTCSYQSPVGKGKKDPFLG